MGILAHNHGRSGSVNQYLTPDSNQETSNVDVSLDHEMAGLTIYEKKCVLINREIDNNGMGRYQWYIWCLCGFGYLLDLLYAQAFGLVLGPLEQEFAFSPAQSGNISVAFSAGLTAGAFVWGVLVDIVGRKWAFNLTCLISAAFGLGIGGCNTYTAFLVVTAFVGFGIGGNIPIDTTICLEFIPQNRRFLLALLSIFQPIGVVVTSAIAYGFIPKYSCSPNFSESNPLPSCNTVGSGIRCCSKADNMGWRYLMFAIGAITLGIFILRFVVFNFQESPKFLVFRGKDDKAIEVLEHIAHVNKRRCGVTKADFESLITEEASLNSARELLGSGKAQSQLPLREKIKIEFARYNMLFSSVQMTRLTILVWLTYICDFWGFTLAGEHDSTYLPKIVALKNGQLNLSLKFTYRSYIAIYGPGIAGVVLGAMMYRVPRIGRQVTMMVSSALMGISIFIFSAVNTEASNIGLNVMEYFFQSMFNAVLYGWTPEVFPAPIRGTACGLASFWGRLFGIIAPLTAENLLPSNGSADQLEPLKHVLYLAGGVTLGCVLFTGLLPRSQVGQQSF
ncbi:MFS general substrate transporter [Acrodontium crateriforme]|uniref:MFS general substrate transporter n=1 Tax=Acrodontium crateriforme TaxID=150365 RepID=A0AAQ3M3M2_9PEZI|nr:MFS general substrate transporter [Acrodontium crateriforme]